MSLISEDDLVTVRFLIKQLGKETERCAKIAKDAAIGITDDGYKQACSDISDKILEPVKLPDKPKRVPIQP